MPSSSAGARVASNGRDAAGAANYDASVTRHVDSLCRPERKGCTDGAAINYDSRATLDDGSCYERVEGCLDRSALNFGCRSWKDQYSACPEQQPPTTSHLAAVCNYEVAQTSGGVAISGSLPDGKRPKNLVVSGHPTHEPAPIPLMSPHPSHS